jgi:hypothetical protein
MKIEIVVHNVHGALSGPFDGLVFSAVAIAVSEPFLLPTAENWSPVGR